MGLPHPPTPHKPRKHSPLKHPKTNLKYEDRRYSNLLLKPNHTSSQSLSPHTQILNTSKQIYHRAPVQPAHPKAPPNTILPTKSDHRKKFRAPNYNPHTQNTNTWLIKLQKHPQKIDSYKGTNKCEQSSLTHPPSQVTADHHNPFPPN